MTLPLWTSLGTIVGVWFVTVLTPGPNFLATVYTATTRSRRLGLMVAAGILVGTAIWATGSLLGLALLFQTATSLFQVVKLAGGVYLIYFGAKTIHSARNEPTTTGTRIRPLSARQAFWHGLVVDLSNPKAAVFFASLFVVTVPPDAALWFKALVISVVVIMAGGWYALVACVVNLPPVATALKKVQKAIVYVTGTIFIALGAHIAADY